MMTSVAGKASPWIIISTSTGFPGGAGSNSAEMARDRRDIARKEDAAHAAAPPAASAPPPAASLASNLSPPHPCLIQLVRLLARQAAAKEIATQRAIATKGD